VKLDAMMTQSRPAGRQLAAMNKGLKGIIINIGQDAAQWQEARHRINAKSKNHRK